MIRRFGSRIALDDVSVVVANGRIHALLGPNGAGKTTLLRILSGLLLADSGTVRIAGVDVAKNTRALRQRIGLVPAGDRSFYLRISGLENLVFFARMHGLSRRQALARATEVLEQVGLAETGNTKVGLYSHGMQKRLSMGRALLTEPDVMLVDEATHDLDPEGAQRIRTLVEELAGDGTAVVWATQRIEEIRGFADSVTLLHHGGVRFAGSVTDLLAYSVPRRYVVRLRHESLKGGELRDVAAAAVGRMGTVSRAGENGSADYLLALADGVVLGRALAAITKAQVDVVTCHEERPELEEVFLTLTLEAIER